jgi:hypothetical protein
MWINNYVRFPQILVFGNIYEMLNESPEVQHPKLLLFFCCISAT